MNLKAEIERTLTDLFTLELADHLSSKCIFLNKTLNFYLGNIFGKVGFLLVKLRRVRAVFIRGDFNS